MGGILNILVGILLLANPAKTTIALVWVLGLYWLIQGIFVLVGMFLDHSAWGWKLFTGILSIIAGAHSHLSHNPILYTKHRMINRYHSRHGAQSSVQLGRGFAPNAIGHKLRT